jgi:hypothetical protein
VQGDKKKTPKKTQNSDMGSDCAYFSGPEDASDDEEGFEDQTFNFDLEDQPRPKKHQTAQKLNHDALSSDGEFADFQH